MSNFILDTSVCIRWYIEGGGEPEKDYATRVLDSLIESECVVPSLWRTELVSVLLEAEKREIVAGEEIFSILATLNGLPIAIDSSAHVEVVYGIAQLARAHNLTAYNAAYLEVAQRMNVPLATIDKKLRNAALRSGVGVYLHDE